MSDEVTIFVCDECGDRIQDESKMVSYRTGQDVGYHVHKYCAKMFVHRMKGEVTDARERLLRSRREVDS